jgi:hypothetical protein
MRTIVIVRISAREATSKQEEAMPFEVSAMREVDRGANCDCDKAEDAKHSAQSDGRLVALR